MKLKLLRQTAAGILLAALLHIPALAISARCAMVLDAGTGQVLFEKNADERCLIASTTKIMTGLLIAEGCDPEDTVVIPPEAAGIEGSSLYLQAGEERTVEELLYGMMLCSGNDAAAALAIHLCGSTEAFAVRMNQRARQLGLTATRFANPHGLDSEENYSTARDLCHLAAHALQNDLFRRVCGTCVCSFGSRSYTNHNKLLRQYPGCIGVKTGYTKAAGRILVSAAEKDGRRLVCVTLSAPDDWRDHKTLLDRGFSSAPAD